VGEVVDVVVVVPRFTNGVGVRNRKGVAVAACATTCCISYVSGAEASATASCVVNKIARSTAAAAAHRRAEKKVCVRIGASETEGALAIHSTHAPALL
jgi:hypothetical protein